MLQVKKISKTYVTGDLKQVALDKVSVNFRECEFVSILGTSGSGKTTLLNIIGGLDHYDSGDLIINNVSTKKYKDRDWDSYRNHSVGFVFQSYNLIPHQTILENVELALTIAGISKKERRKRALKALKDVGLKEQAHKKPNQMSGGQMQRVAIARALVNDPKILLADEPTGALDSETSIQVMDLLKEVAQDRLVIMVTHNPELAENYSTRIVRLKDGKIIGDSNPYEVEKEEKIEYKNLGKASMSLPTAFSLSFNNLLTKKGRTILTAFAGSIGIIGIALILGLSTGFQNYIDKVQEDALTSYPLTVSKETTDTTSILLSAMSSGDDEEVEEGKVLENQNVASMFKSVGYNDVKSFKKYIENHPTEVNDVASYVDYSYTIQPLIYSKTTVSGLKQVNPSSTLSTLMSVYSSSVSMSVFVEMPDNKKIVNDTYELIEGKLPSKYNELMIVLPDDNHISDLLLYTLGLKDDSELSDMLTKVMAGETIEETSEPLTLTYDELMDIELKLINKTDMYKYNSDYNIYEDMSDDSDYLNNLYENGEELKIVGIAKLKSENVTSMAAGVLYTSDLTKHVINNASETDIVKKQLENKEVNVLTGKEFGSTENESLNFEDMISIDTDMLQSAFQFNLSEKDITKITQKYISTIQGAITADTSNANTDFTNALTTMTKNMFTNYVSNNNTMGIATIKATEIESIVNNYLNTDEANNLTNDLYKKYLIPADTFKSVYSELLKGYLTAYIASASTDEGVSAMITQDVVDTMVPTMIQNSSTVANTMAIKMTEATMQSTILTKVGELVAEISKKFGNSLSVDQDKIASAFKFNMDQDQLMRLMTAMYSTTDDTADSILLDLGYQDLEDPTTISFYFKDFDMKERFQDFIDKYNEQFDDEDDKITYTDITGVLISSVKVIVDSVSYVLIAFVSISLVVSSIMIGIITYISVLERTKEIGILRAIGASKRNISSIFNAETFIIGLLSGGLGVGISWALLIPINIVIHNLTGNPDITAVLEITPALILVALSIILTLIGGLIPSKQAAKKDPVLALRTE